MGKLRDLRHAVKALHLNTKKDEWSNNWEFDYHLINEISDITDESEYPVDMEGVESVLIALIKVGK